MIRKYKTHNVISRFNVLVVYLSYITRNYVYISLRDLLIVDEMKTAKSLMSQRRRRCRSLPSFVISYAITIRREK